MRGDRSLGVLTRSPAFAALAGARAVSLVGDGIGSLALVLHVKAEAGTGTAVALLLLVASLPRLLSPLAGTVADRVDQRLVLAGGELGQGLVLIMAVIWLPPLPALLGLLLVKAAIVAISEPAGFSAIPALVDDEDLPAANAMLGGLRQAGEVLGPVLGGVEVALGGVRAGLAVDAATFLVSVPLLARVPRLPPAARETVGGILRDARAGLAYTLRTPAIRSLVAGFFLAGLAAGDDGGDQRGEQVEPGMEPANLEGRHPPVLGTELDQLPGVPDLVGPGLARRGRPRREVEPGHIGAEPAPRLARLGRNDSE